MLDASKQLIETLSPILPTFYELFVDSNTPIPCITYLQSGDSIHVDGDTLCFSDISFNIKIWARTKQEIEQYKIKIDDALRPIGYRRVSYNEMSDKNLLCGILIYRGLGIEHFN